MVKFSRYYSKYQLVGLVCIPWLLTLGIVLFTLFNSSSVPKFQDGKDKLPAHHGKRKPVVLVPGLLGSRIKAKLHMKKSPAWGCYTKYPWFDLWFNWVELTLYINCWVYDVSLRFNNLTGTVRNQDGVRTRIQDFGGTADLEYIDSFKTFPYFNDLVDFLVALGYERGKDLRGAPYDWRRTPSLLPDFMRNLTKLIEDSYYQHFNQKVVLIGHSMGNMDIYYMLKNKPQEWKEKFIDSFISINSPYVGSVKALEAIISGETQLLRYFTRWRLGVGKAIRTFPSFFYLLPRPSLWPKDKSQVVVTKHQNFTVFDYETLFEKMLCKDCWDIWQRYGEELGELESPGVPVHCVYSTQIPTSEKLLYDAVEFPKGVPSAETGDGDGAVSTFSGSYCLNWRSQQNQTVCDVFLPGNTHVDILRNATLFRHIEKVITSDSLRGMKCSK